MAGTRYLKIPLRDHTGDEETADIIEVLRGVGLDDVTVESGNPGDEPLKTIREQAREYAEMGRDFPISGAGGLAEILDADFRGDDGFSV